MLLSLRCPADPGVSALFLALFLLGDAPSTESMSMRVIGAQQGSVILASAEPVNLSLSRRLIIAWYKVVAAAGTSFSDPCYICELATLHRYRMLDCIRFSTFRPQKNSE